VALNTTPYNTQTVFNKTIRFFNTTGDHTNAWVSHDDMIAALGLADWGTRIPGTAGGMCGALPGSIFGSDANIASAAPVLVPGSGYTNCILTSVATTMAANSPRIGVAQQTLQAAVVSAIAAGAAALP
jgi:hypothetical protein